MRYKSLPGPLLKGLLTVSILCCHFSVSAQHRWPPHPPRKPKETGARPVKPYNQRLTLLGHAGSIANYMKGGFGLDYERFLTRQGTLSAHLPLFLFWGADGKNGDPSYGEARTNVHGFFLAPGILYHPFGNRRKADLGIGLGVAIGTFNRKVATFYPPLRSATVAYHDPLLALQAQVHFNLHTNSSFAFGNYGIYIHAGPVFTETGPDPAMGPPSRFLFEAGLKVGGAW